MTANALDAVSILALDLGSVNTRANLFDVADGQYRFIASGISPSTVNAPYFDIGEGITRLWTGCKRLPVRSFLTGMPTSFYPARQEVKASTVSW